MSINSREQRITPEAPIHYDMEQAYAWQAGYESRDAEIEKLEKQITDIGTLWDYQTNKGFQFVSPSLVPALRAVLAGDKLEDQLGFEFLSVM